MKRAAVLFYFSVIVLGYIFPSGSAKAWGEYGHLTVCDLAYRNLTDASKEELKKLFRASEGGITVRDHEGVERRHYTSFNVGCLEEDVVPRRHPKDHFINIDRQTASISSANCPTGGTCVFAGIERDLAILKDQQKTDEERVFALMAVGHWIGDIHQPLHVSFSDDRGGNAIAARLSGKCGSSTYRVKELHGVWDNCLLEAGVFERVRKRADFKKTWGKRTITYRAVDTLLANTSVSEEQAIVGDDPLIWANESLQLTLQPEVLYCVKVGDTCRYSETETTHPGQDRLVQLDQEYLRDFETIAQERVRKAGFRLAHLINLALDPGYSTPIQNSTQEP